MTVRPIKIYSYSVNYPSKQSAEISNQLLKYRISRCRLPQFLRLKLISSEIQQVGYTILVSCFPNKYGAKKNSKNKLLFYTKLSFNSLYTEINLITTK